MLRDIETISHFAGTKKNGRNNEVAVRRGSTVLLFSVDERLELENRANGKNISERKKRTTSGGSPQFSNGFSGKLLRAYGNDPRKGKLAV